MTKTELFINNFLPLMKAGIMVSVPMMLISFALGLVLAFVVALMRMSKIKPVSWLAAAYVWVIRGTPLLVQLFIIYYGLPYVGIVFNPWTSAILGLTLSQGGYNSEVIRSALTAISKGQWEATRALGLTKLQTMRHVIIPQAALIAVPPLGNSFISLLKDTSLVSLLTVREIVTTGRGLIAVFNQPLLFYCEVALVYLIYSTFLTALQSYAEKKLGKHLVGQRN